MKQVQFINSTPEQVSAMVAQEVTKVLESLKNHFQPIKPKEYLTRQEVAKMLNIDLSTLWAWTKKGKLQAYGIGNRIYYLRQEVEAALLPLSK